MVQLMSFFGQPGSGQPYALLGNFLVRTRISIQVQGPGSIRYANNPAILTTVSGGVNGGIRVDESSGVRDFICTGCLYIAADAALVMANVDITPDIDNPPQSAQPDPSMLLSREAQFAILSGVDVNYNATVPQPVSRKKAFKRR